MAKRETTDMVSDLMEMAHRSWQQWLEFGQQWGAQPGQTPDNLDKAWQDNLDSMEKLVQDALRVQGEWIKLCRHAGLGDENAPRPLSDMNETSCNLMENWLEARSALWERWFEQARRLDLNRPDLPLQGDEAREQFFDVWRNMVDTMMKSQQALMHQVEEIAEEQGVAPAAIGEKSQAAESTATRTRRRGGGNSEGEGSAAGGSEAASGSAAKGGSKPTGQAARQTASRRSTSAGGSATSGSASRQKPASH